MNERETVWEKIIELTEDGELVGYCFVFKRKKQQESEAKKDDEQRSKTDKGQA